jgi:hypothetical protein
VSSFTDTIFFAAVTIGSYAALCAWAAPSTTPPPGCAARGAADMAFSISALALFGVLLMLLMRYRALGAGAAVVALLFGFYLARSSAAPSVDQIMSALRDAIPHK